MNPKDREGPELTEVTGKCLDDKTQEKDREGMLAYLITHRPATMPKEPCKEGSC